MHSRTLLLYVEYVYLLILSAVEHLLLVQALLAEQSSWCCQALKLKASPARDCSGKPCKADGLVKREAHGRLCMTSASCYLMLLPGLSCKKLSRRDDVSHVYVCACVRLSTLQESTQVLHYTFSIINFFILILVACWHKQPMSCSNNLHTMTCVSIKCKHFPLPNVWHSHYNSLVTWA